MNNSRYKTVSNIKNVTIEFEDGSKITVGKDEFLKRIAEAVEFSIKDLIIEERIRAGLSLKPGKRD